MNAEQRTRIDLAAAYRLLAHAGVSDLTYNHLSARVPGEPLRSALGDPTGRRLQGHDVGRVGYVRQQ